ncbi:hypothetical protein GCM10010465_11840 [Actinomadura fibrosa]
MFPPFVFVAVNVTDSPIHFKEGEDEMFTVGVLLEFTVIVIVLLTVEQVTSSEEVTITLTLSPLLRVELGKDVPVATSKSLTCH